MSDIKPRTSTKKSVINITNLIFCLWFYLCVVLRADSSMLEFLQYQDQTSQYYSDLMDKLELMNSTLGSMLHYIDNMQGRVEERLHIIQGYLGWAGET